MVDVRDFLVYYRLLDNPSRSWALTVDGWTCSFSLYVTAAAWRPGEAPAFKSPRLRLLRGRVLYTCALGHMALTLRFSQSLGCVCCEVAIRKRHGPKNNASGARARIDCRIIMAGHRPRAQAQYMRLHGIIRAQAPGTGPAYAFA